MDSLHVGLIKGRHLLPVEGYVWTEMVDDPLNFEALELEAQKWIVDVAQYDLDNQVVNTMYLYLTGLTSCTVSFLKAWEHVGCFLADNLVLMHWDRDNLTYLPQPWKVSA